MERIQLTESTMAECVERAHQVLLHGGIVMYPTDTLYGLAADAFSDEAVNKVYAIKGRNEEKPMHCVVSDMTAVQMYADVSDDARLLEKAFWPGPLTLILKKKPTFVHGIVRNIETIGMRVPNHDFCLALASTFGRPYTATSANASGLQPAYSVDEIIEQIGARAEKIDLVIDAGTLPPRQASTVVDLSGAEPVILREGAIESADVWNTIREEM